MKHIKPKKGSFLPFKAMGMVKIPRNILNRRHEIAVGILYLTKEVGWDIESILMEIDMIEEMYNLSRINNPCRLRIEDKKPKNDIDFDKIVKFLNAQKAVMDYASLN